MADTRREHINSKYSVLFPGGKKESTPSSLHKLQSCWMIATCLKTHHTLYNHYYEGVICTDSVRRQYFLEESIFGIQVCFSWKLIQSLEHITGFGKYDLYLQNSLGDILFFDQQGIFCMTDI